MRVLSNIKLVDTYIVTIPFDLEFWADIMMCTSYSKNVQKSDIIQIHKNGRGQELYIEVNGEKMHGYGMCHPSDLLARCDYIGEADAANSEAIRNNIKQTGK